MKWLIILCALLLLAVATPFSAHKADRSEEYVVRGVLKVSGYYLVTDTTYYYGPTYYTSRYVYGIADDVRGVRGYFVLDKENQFKPEVRWTDDGKSILGPDLW